MLNKFFQLPCWMLILYSFIGLVLFGALCWHYEEQRLKERAQKIDSAAEYEGTEICIPYTKIINKNANSVETKDRRGDIFHFVIDTSLVENNNVYSLSGILMSDGKILVADVKKHPYRSYKYLLSLLSFPIVVFMIYKYIRFDKSSFSLNVKRET